MQWINKAKFNKVKIFSILIVLALTSLIILGGIASTAQPTPNPQPTFPYAANYPVFSVANGDGPFVQGNWNVFAPAVRYGDNYHMMAFVLEQLADAEQYTGQMIPILATNWTFADNYHELIVYLRHGVYFYYNGTYNGTQQVIEWPFTAKDVIVTFELYFKVFGNPFGITMSSPNPYEVIFNFTTPNIPYALYTILSGQYIVPWEQYAPLLNSSNPANAVIPVPIGTGPYYLVSQSTNLLIYYRNPIYWIPGRPFLPEIKVYGIYNPQVYSMLAEGQLQWASSGSNGPTPLESLFIDKNPQYYHAMMGFPNGTGGNNWYLYINNLKLNYWPWNQTWFRMAIALALNMTQLSDVATGYLPNGAVPYPTLWYLPPIMAQHWLSPQIYQQGLLHPNVTEALQILEQHGLKIINGKLSFPNGTPLPPVTLYNFVDWSDVYAQAYAFAQEMQTELGLQVQVVSVSPSTLPSYLESGDYELAYWYGDDSWLSPYTVWGFLVIPPLVSIVQLPNGKYAANITALNNTEIRLPNGTLIANLTAAQEYLLNLTQLKAENSPLLKNSTTVFVANITAILKSKTLLSDWERWIPPQQLINLYIQAGETDNTTQLTQIYDQMAQIIMNYTPLIPFTTTEWPFEEWEDQYYIGFSTPQYMYWLNVYVGNAANPSEPIIWNIAPRPPGMTNQQALNFTKQAWSDVLAFLYGKASTATPPSLLAMLGVSPATTTTSTTTSTVTSVSSTTSTVTTTSVTTTTSTVTTTSLSTVTTTSTVTSSSTTLYVAIAVVVIVIIVIIGVVLALRRRR